MTTLEQLRSSILPGRSVGFVPTMGALHEGHIALMRESVESCELTIASIFVNPAQFGASEDIDRYPRELEGDKLKCSEAGVTILFTPTNDDVYDDSYTTVDVGPVSRRWEGEHRTGHFTGVATVVAKLFGMIGPCTAFFGRKDLQQCAVIKQLVHDLFLPVTLRFVETVRETDGLAMSSRNRYFDAAQRADVAELPSILHRTCTQISKASPLEMGLILAESQRELEQKKWHVDYFACVDSDTLESVVYPTKNSRCIVAARKYGVRLIDNMAIFD